MYIMYCLDLKNDLLKALNANDQEIVLTVFKKINL
jgi:hypothetical protein